MATAREIVIKALEAKLRDMYPDRSEFQIRPLARMTEKLLATGLCADFAFQNTLERYQITEPGEVGRFKSLMKAAREEVMRLRPKIIKNQLNEGDFILVC